MTQTCVVVTGGARNIGQAIAIRLLADGLRVVALEIADLADAEA
jgi:NAD(P)-dependent dehydrogenase (short-subunit alcohol dehydrogenase family)